MANDFGFHVSGVKEVQKAFADMETRARRATMWALRETGRTVQREAKRRTPVLQDKSVGMSMRQMRALPKGANSSGMKGPPVRGLLRASIHQSKRFRREGDAYAIKVGPRGPRVHLYAGKIEERARYMRDAYDTVMPLARAIHEKAWAKAMSR